MTNESEKEELYELLKDENSASDSVFIGVERRLSLHKDIKAPLHLKSKILLQAKQTHTYFWPQKILLAVAIVCLSFAVILIVYDSFSKPSRSINTNQTSDNQTQANNQPFELTQNLGITLPQQHKYYALYFSSTLCKPCVDMLSELDKFYIEQKSKNADFEIVYIEMNKHNFATNQDPAIHFKKVELKEIKNKEVINKYREGHGPAFVVIDNKGNIVTKHKKNVHQNTFSTVLEQFSTILSKS